MEGGMHQARRMRGILGVHFGRTAQSLDILDQRGFEVLLVSKAKFGQRDGLHNCLANIRPLELDRPRTVELFELGGSGWISSSTCKRAHNVLFFQSLFESRADDADDVLLRDRLLSRGDQAHDASKMLEAAEYRRIQQLEDGGGVGRKCEQVNAIGATEAEQLRQKAHDWQAKKGT